MLKKVNHFTKTIAARLNKWVAPVLAVGAGVGLMPTVYAGGAADPAVAIEGIIDIVFTIFRFIGIILALWGVGSLVMAFKNEDADSKSRAIMSLVVGVCLVGLDPLFGTWVRGLI